MWHQIVSQVHGPAGPSGHGVNDEVRDEGDPATLLVTGFGPFEEYSRNPSGDFAESIDGHATNGLRVAGASLPVSWRRGWRRLRELVLDLQPRAMICFGVAPIRSVNVELLAKNLAWPSKDVDGQYPPCGRTMRIDPAGPPAYWSTLPWSELTHAARELGPLERDRLDVMPSTSAGDYLCNYVFYKSLHAFHHVLPLQGFVHIPCYADDSGDRGFEGSLIHATCLSLVERVAGRTPGSSPLPRIS